MIIPESFIKDICRLLVWFPARWTMGALAPRRDFTLIKFMARLYYHYDTQKVSHLAENISRVFDLLDPSLTIKRIVLHNLETHFMNQYLVFLFSKFNKRTMSCYHSFEGWENLEYALAKGRGCIIVHGHFGPAQLPLVHLGLKDLLVTQIGYHRNGNDLSPLGRMVQRKKISLEIHDAVNFLMADSFLRPVFRLLKNNGIVMMTGDGVGGGEFIGRYCNVPFLTQTMLFPEGPASLARKTGAALLAAFTVPSDDNRYVTVIEKPLGGFFVDKGESSIKEIVQEFAALLEKYVKKYPFHWHFWDEFEEGKLIQ